MTLGVVKIKSPVPTVLQGNSACCDKEHEGVLKEELLEEKQFSPCLLLSGNVEIFTHG